MQSPPWPFVFKLETTDGHLSLPEPISSASCKASNGALFNHCCVNLACVIPARQYFLTTARVPRQLVNKVYKALHDPLMLVGVGAEQLHVISVPSRFIEPVD